MPDDPAKAKLEIPPDNPFNIQARKHFIFNETGNIMLASTEADNADIEPSVRDIFAEVSVFFSAMTRAISTTENPSTGKPYSLYNYTALERIISGSGLFIHVTESDLEHETHSFGATFSKELLEGLLGLATGVGAMSFAQGMLASIGKEAIRMGADTSSTDSKVANIVFVCEYLLGMPMVTAIVVYADVHSNKESFELGPCFKVSNEKHKWTMHKDTYMFVTPKFIAEYSEDLDRVGSDVNFGQLVEYLRSALTQSPIIHKVVDAQGNDVTNGSALTKGDTYSLMGNNLGEAVSVKMVGEDNSLTVTGGANYSRINFSVSATAPDVNTAKAIEIYNADDQLIIASSDAFKIQ